MVVVAPKKACDTLRSVEDLFLELSNVKKVEYAQKTPKHASAEGWVSTTEGKLQVFLDGKRDEGLLGEGLMRDLARRVQTLRKELGYKPTDVLEDVHVAELDEEDIRLLQDYLKDMATLVRAKKVHINGTREEAKAEWHESQLDDKKVYVAIT
jgi:isoleucyl-tRNA synthetase